MTGPLNTAVVADFIEPEHRAGFMGLHVVGMGVGAMLGNLIGGMFAGIGYKYFYLVYLIAFFSAFGVAVNLKETAPLKGEKVSDMKMTGIVWLTFTDFFCTYIVY